MKELALRILVSIFGIPLLLFLFYKGGLYFFTFITLVSIIGQWEMYNILQKKDTYPQRFPGIVFGLNVLALIQFGGYPLLKILLLILLFYLFASEMFYNKGSSNLNIAATLFGVIYPALFLGALLYLRNHVQTLFPGNEHNASFYLIFVIISIWICDTFAYFFGKTFGRHKLFERVSPKKSIEGALAGVIGALFVFLIAKWSSFLSVSYFFAIISGLIAGVIGQIGDLVESWFKRDAQIKDSSRLLPGHGGMLDRFDSLLFVSPAFLIFYFFWTL